MSDPTLARIEDWLERAVPALERIAAALDDGPAPRLVELCGAMSGATGGLLPYICALPAGHPGPHSTNLDDGDDYDSEANHG